MLAVIAFLGFIIVFGSALVMIGGKARSEQDEAMKNKQE